jgi:arabinan endo-1,5-alpha-L-arabinosidase
VSAPEVTRRGVGDYLLYFVARSAALEAQCIGFALATRPAGPFRPATGPLICQSGVDSIDPQGFADTDGAHYLLYASGRHVTTIWLQRIAEDRVTPLGPRRALISADRPEEAHIVEAPSLLKHGSTYFLFYSGNTYNSGAYFINDATSSSAFGPFVKRPGEFLSRASLAGFYTNPGGQSVVRGPHGDYLVFHASVSRVRGPCSSPD